MNFNCFRFLDLSLFIHVYISLSAMEDMETQLNASDEDQKQIFRHRKRCLLQMIFFPTK